MVADFKSYYNRFPNPLIINAAFGEMVVGSQSVGCLSVGSTLSSHAIIFRYRSRKGRRARRLNNAFQRWKEGEQTRGEPIPQKQEL